VPAALTLLFLALLVLAYPPLLRRAKRLASASAHERSLLSPYQDDLDLLDRPCVNQVGRMGGADMKQSAESAGGRESASHRYSGASDNDSDHSLLLSEHLFPVAGATLSPAASTSVDWEENTTFGVREKESERARSTDTYRDI
jgi:hypothetical protein